MRIIGLLSASLLLAPHNVEAQAQPDALRIELPFTFIRELLPARGEIIGPYDLGELKSCELSLGRAIRAKKEDQTLENEKDLEPAIAFGEGFVEIHAGWRGRWKDRLVDGTINTKIKFGIDAGKWTVEFFDVNLHPNDADLATINFITGGLTNILKEKGKTEGPILLDRQTEALLRHFPKLVPFRSSIKMEITPKMIRICVDSGSDQFQDQDNWRWCSDCQGLFFAGWPSKGRCPSGGEHKVGISANYVLKCGKGQPLWRWCSKCQGLFYSCYESKGRCPAGGEHKVGISFNYSVLTEKDTPEGFGQPLWRWCWECQGLFYSGHESKGRCPAGGEHKVGVSANYFLYIQN